MPPVTGVASVLALQRSAGNAATSRMLSREEGVPTYDTKTEKWTTADPRGTAAKEDEGRRFGQADAGKERQAAVASSLGAVKTVEEIDALELAQIEDINPKSIVPYHVIKNVLHESWHVAKELLLDPKAPNGNRRALMTKLWEYRQWHHQEVLEDVKEKLNKDMNDAEALKASAGAGSATLSSDIDVNLKGNHTEKAVPLFNELFRNPKRASIAGHVWENEPGVVYDVNVYAIDFMHKFGFNEVGDKRVTQKEGARPGKEGGGIGAEHMAGTDRQLQLITSLFKARLFMSAPQWAAYEQMTLRGLQDSARDEQEKAFRGAEERFAGYLAEMSAKMGVKLDVVADQATSGVDQLKAGAKSLAPGGEHDHAADAKQENILMTAANRLYESKLEVIHGKRAKLKKLIDQLKVAPAEEKANLEEMIDGSLLALRFLVAEAAMYANEASMTDATIHHGVVGIQGGKEIDQTKAEGVNAVNEHLADVMKEAGRYGPELGPGAYKAGKYLMRLGDAGKNLGFGYIHGVGVLYDLGRKLSEDIKVRADKGGVDTAKESAEAVKAIAGKASLDDLLKLAMETAAQVTQEYNQERSAHTDAGEADTDTAFGHRTAPKKAENKNVLNQDMQHPADRGADNPKAKGDLTPADAGDFSFRLTEKELEALRAKWAARTG